MGTTLDHMTQPQRYTKQPVTIEAIQWDGTEPGSEPIIEWVKTHGGTAAFDRIPVAASRYNTQYDLRIYINTLEGPMTANPGDYIIRGVKNEFYPCKPEIFAETYRPADTE